MEVTQLLDLDLHDAEFLELRVLATENEAEATVELFMLYADRYSDELNDIGEYTKRVLRFHRCERVHFRGNFSACPPRPIQGGRTLDDSELVREVCAEVPGRNAEPRFRHHQIQLHDDLSDLDVVCVRCELVDAPVA